MAAASFKSLVPTSCGVPRAWRADPSAPARRGGGGAGRGVGNGSEIRCVVSPCVVNLKGVRLFPRKRDHTASICRLEATSVVSKPRPRATPRHDHAVARLCRPLSRYPAAGMPALVMIERGPPSVRAFDRPLPGQAHAAASRSQRSGPRWSWTALAVSAARLAPANMHTLA